MDISTGRYWDKPWSLVSGCTPCSPGCEHCWSAAMTHRWSYQWTKFKNNYPGQKPTGVMFNGKITVHPDRLDIPVKRRKPTVYSIWNDLMHKAVPNSFIGKVFEAMASCQRHTFLILTKRPERMIPFVWPDNVWTGLTVCNQAEADAKIPIFLQVPGKKFLSIEPMLEPIDFSYNRFCGIMGWGPPEPPHPGLSRESWLKGQSTWVLGKIDAVILGGETGPGARPMHPDWVRSVRDQCQSADVPFFFKQWGEWVHYTQYCFGVGAPCLSSVKVENELYRVGRKAAGRLLDGRTHNDLPWVQA